MSIRSLIAITDRIRDMKVEDPSLEQIIHELHLEAPIRYSCNKHSEDSYELLKRFQVYDDIIHKIDASNYKVSLAFLCREPALIHKILLSIFSHTENLIFLNYAKVPVLQCVLSKLYLEAKQNLLREPDLILLNNIKVKMSNYLPMNSRVRYEALSKISIEELKKHYDSFFSNIKFIIDGGENLFESKTTPMEIIIRKWANGYHIQNSAKSIDGLRALISERRRIFQFLNSIDFSYLHLINLSNLKLNNIIPPSNKEMLPMEYIETILKTLVTRCTNRQLESLYRPLRGTDTGNHAHVSNVLRNLISSEAHKRTGLLRRVYNFITFGDKNSFLKEIREPELVS
jgi:hypothetical protein